MVVVESRFIPDVKPGQALMLIFFATEENENYEKRFKWLDDLLSCRLHILLYMSAGPLVFPATRLRLEILFWKAKN